MKGSELKKQMRGLCWGLGDPLTWGIGLEGSGHMDS